MPRTRWHPPSSVLYYKRPVGPTGRSLPTENDMLVKDRLAHLLRATAHEAQARGLLPPVDLPEIVIERPQNPEHGDYAANLPLRLARAAQMSPMVIAQRLVSLLPAAEEVAQVEVAPPGFINFRLDRRWLARQVDEIVAQNERFGELDIGQGRSVQVEYVSANPTGPLHVGNGRGAVLGNVLSRALAAAGYRVQQEYYVNDAGTQTETFYASLDARYRQALGQEVALPPDGYQGDYVVELAREIVAEHGDRFLQGDPNEARQTLGALGIQRMLSSIRTDLDALGVRYDDWFSERSLYDVSPETETSPFARAMGLLREKRFVVEKEGATWFTSTTLGEDKDNVLIRSSGAPTYFALDIAYHLEKFTTRGFDQVIDIWGADHQGHVPRMRAAAAALGIAPERLHVIIYQLVNLKRGGVLVRASKRTGELVTLRDLLDEVGVEACRYFFLTRSADSAIDFDLELAKQQSAENPLYYIQYAHARIASILRNAQELGLSLEGGDTSLLTEEAELVLLRKMLELPELIESIAHNLEPHHLPHYALELATAFHDFYERHRVLPRPDVPVDPALTAARLKLTLASRYALAKVLDLMGLSAPERM